MGGATRAPDGGGVEPNVFIECVHETEISCVLCTSTAMLDEIGPCALNAAAQVKSWESHRMRAPPRNQPIFCHFLLSAKTQ